ncbi:hypothetical protein CBL_21098 [Carabus blaptoides fortunei]
MLDRVTQNLLSRGDRLDREEVAEATREQLRRKAEKRRCGQARRGGRIVRFRVGDWVLLKTNPVTNPLQKINPKFCLLYEGPYEISANPFPNAYALVTETGQWKGVYDAANLRADCSYYEKLVSGDTRKERFHFIAKLIEIEFHDYSI